jgi:glycosyltransferase involved in cell wall biosynthesis
MQNRIDFTAQDALHQLLAEPTQSFLWDNLVQALFNTQDLVLRGQLIGRVLAQAGATGLPGFHAHLLANYCNMGDAHLTVACEALLATQTGMTRQLALLAYMWRTLMNASPSRSDFLRVGSAWGMADLALSIQQRVVQLSETAGWKFGRRRGRVAVVLTEASVEGHPPTRGALDHVAVLLRAGYQVQIFSASEWQVAEIWQWLGVGRNFQFLPQPLEGLSDWRAYLGDALGDGANLTYTLIDQALIPERRYAAVLSRLAEFAPEWITLVGLTSGLSQVLYRNYPVVAMSTLSVQPMAPVDVWLSPAYPPQQEVAPWHAQMPIGRVQHRMMRLAEIDRAGARNREALHAQLGLAPGALVVLSAGVRLPSEMPGTWLEQWAIFLAQHPQVVWLLVGTTSEIEGVDALVPTGQIRRLGYVANFADATASVDIVANPRRIGGGTSVAMAMAAGVPVVSYADCDGGDKVQEFAVHDDAAYFLRLGHWVRDAQARADAGEAMRSMLASRPDNRAMAHDFLQAGALDRPVEAVPAG